MTTTEPTADELAGMDWWNSIDKAERAFWLAKAGTAVPAEAWAEYQRAEAARIQRPATVKQEPA